LRTSLPKVIWKEGCVAAKASPDWLQWRAPNSPPKVPLPVDRSPNPTTCLIIGPVRPMIPNDIRIRSAVFPQCTGQTDRPTDYCGIAHFVIQRLVFGIANFTTCCLAPIITSRLQMYVHHSARVRNRRSKNKTRRSTILAKGPVCCCLHNLHWVQQRNLPFSTYFTPKTATLGFDPSRSSRVKSAYTNREPVAAFKKVLSGLQPRICHRFQDISNQRIVTFTFNFSRSAKVKPMDTVYIIISVDSSIVTLAVLGTFHIKKYDLDF